jgi:adenylate cyclase
MKYRTKLYLSLVGTAFASTFFALSILYTEIEQLFLKHLHSKVMTIAATTSTLINTQDLEKIKTAADETSPGYLALREQLIKVKNSNRLAGINVKDIYTLFPSPTNPKLLLFGVDAADPQEIAISHVGDPYQAIGKYDLLENLYQTFSPPHFVHDEWGTWFSGFAPIYNEQGKYIGTLGVDLDAKEVKEELLNLLKFGALALLISLVIALSIAFILSKIVTNSLSILHEGLKQIGDGNLNVKVSLKTHDEFNEVAEAINEMTTGLIERERLKMNFARYVSQHMLEKILKSNVPLKLEGERRKITVLFSDIRQFTHLAEKLAPEVVVSILNEYFERMLDIVFKNQGTLDKFIGDGIMVEFGAPLDDPNQERHAVLTALEMQEGVKALSEKWEKENKPILRIGIGVHSGFAIVGNIGSEKRMEYTAIGDTVNVASRLEFATKILKTPILISETVCEAVKDQFELRNLGALSLPGMTREMTVYAVYGIKIQESKSERKE